MITVQQALVVYGVVACLLDVSILLGVLINNCIGEGSDLGFSVSDIMVVLFWPLCVIALPFVGIYLLYRKVVKRRK